MEELSRRFVCLKKTKEKKVYHTISDHLAKKEILYHSHKLLFKQSKPSSERNTTHKIAMDSNLHQHLSLFSTNSPGLIFVVRTLLGPQTPSDSLTRDAGSSVVSRTEPAVKRKPFWHGGRQYL